MQSNIFNERLQQAGTRVAHSVLSTRFQLDKNEQTDDVDFALKQQVVNCLLNANWNRYPTSDYRDIEAKIAGYCDLQPENIALSAGSASIITTLLDYFALNQKRIIITQPSYSLFDYHCQTYNINYESWLLTPELEYDYDNIPKLDANSVLIVTTPNNPVGNTFDAAKLEKLLTDNPQACIILDAVYCEFCQMDIAPLVRKYENLIVLRSFSKAFPIAGLRLGYLCAAPKTTAAVRKLLLQFSICHFSLIFAREMLFTPEFMETSRRQVREIIAERERMCRLLTDNYDRQTLKVFKSAGNFLLIRVFDDAAYKQLLADLEAAGIRVLNTSRFPLLYNTLRVSIGSRRENEAFLNCLHNSLAGVSADTALLADLLQECFLADKSRVGNGVGDMPRESWARARQERRA